MAAGRLHVILWHNVENILCSWRLRSSCLFTGVAFQLLVFHVCTKSVHPFNIYAVINVATRSDWNTIRQHRFKCLQFGGFCISQTVQAAFPAQGKQRVSTDTRNQY